MQRYVAEAIGVFALVFAGCGAIVVNELGAPVTHVGVALTFGLVIMAMIFAVGDVSGAHFNPAVTVAFWAARRFPGRQVLPYVFSQCVGAVIAAALLRLLFIQHAPADIANLGVTTTTALWWQAGVMEILLTAILMFVILSVSTGAKERGITAAIAIGGTVGLEALFAGPITGASMNPARSLGPALLSLELTWLPLYIIAPMLGGLLAVVGCHFTRPATCCGGACSGEPA